MCQIVDEMEDTKMDASAATTAKDDDVEASLKQELEGMTQQKSTRFRLCQHDTPCGMLLDAVLPSSPQVATNIPVIYINVLPPLDPVQLVYRILERVESSGQCPFK